MSKDYHVVSFSGGKDSTAMLLRMIELGWPIDEIIFCDTGVEFPAMYEHIKKVEQYIGRKITTLKWEHPYEYYLCEIEVKRRASRYKRLLERGEAVQLNTKGYSFAGARSRWCTRMKVTAFNKHTKGKSLVRYIGIAADEPKRIGEYNYPLVEWGWTEADCLAYCKAKGFDWGGLYDIFKRVSCWCCPLQSLSELRKLRHNFPELWQTLLDWQHKTWRKFRADYSVDELEAKFATEDEMEKRQVKLF
jgi:3'-phosphoadenosine 5'-phosphosulfate sulfotransferase (PAPS reductase)/FAD synthetase